VDKVIGECSIMSTAPYSIYVCSLEPFNKNI